jgi:hypothetical protein
MNKEAGPWLKWAVAGLLPRVFGFKPRPVVINICGGNLALGRGF